VLVTDADGKALLDHVMKPGETFPVPDQDGLKLTTGNSSGITLLLDGKPLPRLARTSSILHDVPLDISALKAGPAKSQ
jgi:cytoskeleton protein RodZ